MSYTCHDVFMIRTPALPTHIAKEIYGEKHTDVWEYLKEIKLDIFFTEAMQLSSPSLYQAIEKIDENDEAKSATCLSLYKYLIRSSTRTTPYGLLANVALCEFRSNASVIERTENIKKEVQLDYYWLFALIKQLEDKRNVLSKLSLRWNDNCYFSNDRIRNPVYLFRNIAETVRTENSSIRSNSLIRLVKDNSKVFIQYKDLADMIKEKYADATEDKIYGYISDLIKQEYLFSELRIPAYCKNPIEHIVKILTKNNLQEDVKQIQRIQRAYNKYKEQGGRKNLTELIKLMKQQIEIETGIYVNTNAGVELMKNSLNLDVKKRLESFISCITRIGLEADVYSPLKKFKEKFEEEYGKNVHVPLTQIIDPSGFNGLELLGRQNENKMSEREIKIENLFEKKIQEAIYSGKRKAELFSKDFEKVEKIEDGLTESFDLNIILTKTGDEAHLTIGPNLGAMAAGRSFQRFSDVFNEEDFTRYNQIYKFLNMQEEIIELREYPAMGRAANLINNAELRESSLALGMPLSKEKTAVKLEHLAVGLNESGLYLVWIDKNTRCKIAIDNMINSKLNSCLFNFIKAISEDSTRIYIIERFDFLLSNQYIYTPEIRIEGVTVALERWRITEDLVNATDLDSFEKSFREFDQIYNLPDFFYLCKSDNRLLLAKNCDVTSQILYQEIKRIKIVHLSAIEEGLLGESYVKNHEGENFVSECVFSFYQTGTQKKHQQLCENRLIQNEKRILKPFQEGWIYLKLYINPEQENAFLITFQKKLHELGIEKFFFLRYFDESGKHIRLRIKYIDERSAIYKFQRLNRWLQDITSQDLINTWSIHEYRRENNRYGGYEIIESIETLFFKNSREVIKVLELLEFNDEIKEKEDIYFVTVARYAKRLLHSKENVFTLLDKVVDKGHYRDSYREKREEYMCMLEMIFREEERDAETFILEIVDDLKRKDNNLTNSFDEIILSLIHMCCNRLNGDRTLEQKTYCLLRHALHDVIAKENALFSKHSKGRRKGEEHGKI